MSRALSRREKVLITFLAILLVILTYYLLVYQPVTEELSASQFKMEEVKDSITLEQAKTLRLAQMRSELEKLKESGADVGAPMAVYDNVQNIITRLADILSAASDYNLNFSPLVTTDNLVRRSIGMNFTCDSFETARSIVEQLSDSPYRCLVGDLSMTAELAEGANPETEPDLVYDAVQVNLTATFYEVIQAPAEIPVS